MSRFLRDPFFHFIVAGALLWLLVEAASPPLEQNTTIRIERVDLIAFIQFQTKVFDASRAAEKLDKMDAVSLAQLTRDYIRSEVLYREALLLGLDEGDPGIRARMIQKMEFLTEGFAGNADEVNGEEAQAYFDDHKERYQRPAHITFTHIFTRDDKAEAEELLNELHNADVPFEGAISYGDRFPFGLNFVERGRGYVAARFGDEFARNIFAFSGDLGRWSGPLISDQGYHLVMVSAFRPIEQLSFASVEDRVINDLLVDRKRELQKATIDKLIQRYNIQKGTIKLRKSGSDTP